MPVHGHHIGLQEDGDRLLLANNGLFMEVRRPWIEGTVKIAPALPVSVPWGAANQSVRLLCGIPPDFLLKEFLSFARQHDPIECGAILTWKETGEWRIRYLESEFADEDHLSFVRPTLNDGEHFVVDIHSHGRHAANFSHTDNKQDSIGELKISGVFGCVSSSQLRSVWRICFNGFLTKTSPEVGILLDSINSQFSEN